jgi:hypothetical protein
MIRPNTGRSWATLWQNKANMQKILNFYDFMLVIEMQKMDLIKS